MAKGKDCQRRGPVPVPGLPTSERGRFNLKSDGLYVQEGGKMRWVCSPIEKLGMVRNAEGGEWGTLVEVWNSDGGRSRLIVRWRDLAGDGREYRRDLMAIGLRTAPGRGASQLLHKFLIEPCDHRVRLWSRVGWHEYNGGHLFVLPDRVHGADDGGEAHELERIRGCPKYAQQGSLADWQDHVGSLAVGNSRLTFAISCAFAAPLLRHLGLKGFLFHLCGGSSLGKTTALRVMQSVIDSPSDLRTWHATGNGLEEMAAVRCDIAFPIDELGMVDGRSLGRAIYMLAEGRGKARAAAQGGSRDTHEWVFIGLSTGEISVAAKMAEAGDRSRPGQDVRVPEIPADAGKSFGLFENLHGESGGEKLSDRLTHATQSYYGVAFAAYLIALTSDLPRSVREAKGIMTAFLLENCPPRADGQVKRVCQNFAAVAAGGELAVAKGILPWAPGEARSGARICFQRWLENRGNVGSAESMNSLARVAAWLEQHGSSRMELWGHSVHGDPPRTHNRAGWRRQNDEGEWDYYILSDPRIFFRKSLPPAAVRIMVRGHEFSSSPDFRVSCPPIC